MKNGGNRNASKADLDSSIIKLDRFGADLCNKLDYISVEMDARFDQMEGKLFSIMGLLDSLIGAYASPRKNFEAGGRRTEP